MPERLPTVIRRGPSAEAVAWAARASGPGRRILSVRRLRGGSSSSVHAITVEDAAGARHQLVLRRYVRADWLAEEPDVVERETRVLRALATTPVPAPELIACDEDGSHAGVPAVLMRRIPGGPCLARGRLEKAIEPMARLLASIHALSCSTVPRLQPYRVWHDPADDGVPHWSRAPQAWSRLIEADRAPMPPTPAVLLHRDFHPGNVLWFRGRLAGVTDWVNACCGPPGIDVGHCRVNLAMLLGVAAAEHFREVYERAAGRSHVPQFDARAMLDFGIGPVDLAQFHDAGRTELTAEAVHARRDEFAVFIAARLSRAVAPGAAV
jgi:aminoglycoside phosphotransferase (APT) family kinase protein